MAHDTTESSISRRRDGADRPAARAGRGADEGPGDAGAGGCRRPGGIAPSTVRPTGARTGGDGLRQGARAAAAGRPDRRRDRLPARPGDALIHANPPPRTRRGGGGGSSPALRRPAHRHAGGAGTIAFAFFLGALVFLHIALWYWLRQSWDRPAAALIIGGGELVLAALLGLLAARSSPGRIEAEALAVRRRALESATSGLAFSALATQLLPLAIRLMRRR